MGHKILNDYIAQSDNYLVGVRPTERTPNDILLLRMMRWSRQAFGIIIFIFGEISKLIHKVWMGKTRIVDNPQPLVFQFHDLICVGGG